MCLLDNCPALNWMFILAVLKGTATIPHYRLIHAQDLGLCNEIYFIYYNVPSQIETPDVYA